MGDILSLDDACSSKGSSDNDLAAVSFLGTSSPHSRSWPLHPLRNKNVAAAGVLSGQALLAGECLLLLACGAACGGKPLKDTLASMNKQLRLSIVDVGYLITLVAF